MTVQVPYCDCNGTYKLAGNNCPGKMEPMARRGLQPGDKCPDGRGPPGISLDEQGKRAKPNRFRVLVDKTCACDSKDCLDQMERELARFHEFYDRFPDTKDMGRLKDRMKRCLSRPNRKP